MAHESETPILIVGAGPVGLTLAMDLAGRGIDATVVEQRRRGDPPDPKCNHVAARTMEVFRRLGFADTVRNAGLPADYPHAIAYRTSFTGSEISRVHIPCRRDRFTDETGVDSDWPTAELPHRINQLFLDPILLEQAIATPRVRVLSHSSLESFEQRADDVVTCVRDLDTGRTQHIACRYMIGCDGGKSVVRKALGITLEGDAVIQRVQATFIRAPDLIHMQRHARAWMTNAVNPRRSGNVIAIDGRERWMIFNYLRPDEADFDAVDRDWAIRTILGVGPEFRYEVISREDWVGRRLIAPKFRDGRVFLAGDAAHIWVPYAGYGMNAGIADAMTLSWLLAAHFNGWAPESILDAYEAERWPITEQVSRFAMAHAEREIKRRGEVPPEIEAEGPDGDRIRAEVGKLAYEINVHQYAAAGLNFGYYYDRSPLIAYDGSVHPAYTMSTYEPSTVPGCRAPHLWLGDGRSLYDALGPEYTLLRFDHSIDIASLRAAAESRRLPLTVLDVPATDDSAIYANKLLIVRPDQHIAWRGDAAPTDARGLVDRLRGGIANQVAVNVSG